MTYIIYSHYPDLPEIKAMQEAAKQAHRSYQSTLESLRIAIKKAEEIHSLSLQEWRQNIKYDYTVIVDGDYSQIKRTTLNSSKDDLEFCREIETSPFKIVNKVFIAKGSGYKLPYISGDIILEKDEMDLAAGKVPDSFKFKD